MNKLDRVLDEVMELSLEQQEILVEILKNRINENRREKIAQDALISLKEFHTGKLKIQTAQEAIKELEDYLNNSNQDV